MTLPMEVEGLVYEDIETSLNKIKMAFIEVDESRGDVHYLGVGPAGGHLFQAYLSWLPGKTKARLGKSSALARLPAATHLSSSFPDLPVRSFNEAIKLKDIQEVIIIGKHSVAVDDGKKIYVIQEKIIFDNMMRLYRSLHRVTSQVDIDEQQQEAKKK
ncbi:hypothetical protein HNP46_000153 [Pseudomonas nitritireducens]|uniref:Uncharacterized protein n=1 Tax=Pseudomonas nitroreducens TaxID=46680 RepID=A0A7W7KEG6_PSENT|nr:hypothetical protein [Pseudomonas nitritireducens]MBB4861342.1 hypothetical protein [Pseudomonas nitritireducens]